MKSCDQIKDHGYDSFFKTTWLQLSSQYCISKQFGKLQLFYHTSRVSAKDGAYLHKYNLKIYKYKSKNGK